MYEIGEWWDEDKRAPSSEVLIEDARWQNRTLNQYANTEPLFSFLVYYFFSKFLYVLQVHDKDELKSRIIPPLIWVSIIQMTLSIYFWILVYL